MGRPNLFKVNVTFGRLTGLFQVEQGHAWYRCTCGKFTHCSVSQVQRGHVQSCGCLHAELISAITRQTNTRHGKFNSRIYSIWQGMKKRCLSPTHIAYKYYGGRGITIDPRWLDFNEFYADMGDPPPGLSIERADNNLGYSKANCKWATDTAQANNKRSNVPLTFAGKTQNITQWATHLGISRNLIYGRIARGWSADRALTTPARFKTR